jgi:hypothetical protein
MTPRLSKALLTSHITFSLGWLGAVAVFLALAITGLTSDDILLARASLIAMEISAWFVIVPFCLTSLFTGVIQASMSRWGLFKHYWVVVKLFLTVTSTALLLLHMKPISYLAGVATAPSFSNSQNSVQLIDLIVKAGAAILVLLFITAISVYKPWGKVQFAGLQGKRSWKFYALIALIGLVLLGIIKHLFGGEMLTH